MTTSRNLRIVVFLGPSLPADEASALLDAEYRPPARQGDVYRVLAAGVDTIVLIDGVFHNTPSVWQRELLDALEDGITVVGGASMGAIRAAELESFGMQGSGTVFRWYRDGMIDGDDEVALRHSDADHGFRALSEPLVNIRATLAAAVSQGCLRAEAAAALVEQAKTTYYPDRCYQQLLAGPLARGWPIAVRSGLIRFLRHRAIDLKRADAIETLRRVAEMSAPGGSPPPRGNGTPASAGSLWAASRPLSACFGTGREVSGAEILRRARTDHDLTAGLRRDAMVRCYVSELARWRQVRVPEDGIRSARRQRTLPDEAWLAANGLTPAAYFRLLEKRARHRWLTLHLAGSGHAETPAGTNQCITGRERALLLAWARAAGVVYQPQTDPGHRPEGASDGVPDEAADSEQDPDEALLRWLLHAGPGHFGLFWHEDLAILEELQTTGAAARLADAVPRSTRAGRMEVSCEH
jgi:hypothetical protein